jgi:hypothetical protein
MTYVSPIGGIDLLQIKLDLVYINENSAEKLSLLIVTNLLFKIRNSI